jgi:hypothetical protein
MAHDPALPRVVPPAQCEHVTVLLDDDCLVPALPRILICQDEIADADLLPIPRQTRRRAARVGEGIGHHKGLGIGPPPDILFKTRVLVLKPRLAARPSSQYCRNLFFRHAHWIQHEFFNVLPYGVRCLICQR